MARRLARCFVKGSWEAIFRVTDKKKCETILNEGLCVTVHHITMRSVRLHSMKGCVLLYITSQWEVWDYIQWRVVCYFTSHHNEKCEMRRGQMRWHEVKRNQMIWDKMSCGMWSASVKREVQGVKSAVWSVKKMFAWCCIATWSHAGHVLGQQQCNKFVQSKHARRKARASSRDEKGFIIKSKATSSPPRAGTTGIDFQVFTHHDMVHSGLACPCPRLCWQTIPASLAQICWQVVGSCADSNLALRNALLRSALPGAPMDDCVRLLDCLAGINKAEAYASNQANHLCRLLPEILDDTFRAIDIFKRHRFICRKHGLNINTLLDTNWYIVG